jgi:hypothetical protein
MPIKNDFLKGIGKEKIKKLLISLDDLPYDYLIDCYEKMPKPLYITEKTRRRIYDHITKQHGTKFSVKNAKETLEKLAKEMGEEIEDIKKIKSTIKIEQQKPISTSNFTQESGLFEYLKFDESYKYVIHRISTYTPPFKNSLKNTINFLNDDKKDTLWYLTFYLMLMAIKKGVGVEIKGSPVDPKPLKDFFKIDENDENFEVYLKQNKKILAEKMKNYLIENYKSFLE